jgi:hypothetical protein
MNLKFLIFFIVVIALGYFSDLKKPAKHLGNRSAVNQYNELSYDENRFITNDTIKYKVEPTDGQRKD